MATAGSGDVLAGVIAGFLAQGIMPCDAACLGTFVHGLAGDIGADKKGPHSLMASDIVNCLPEAIKGLSNDT